MKTPVLTVVKGDITTQEFDEGMGSFSHNYYDDQGLISWLPTVFAPETQERFSLLVRTPRIMEDMDKVRPDS